MKDIDTDAIITEGVTIEAIDGPHQETLVLSESSNSFYGAGERAGTYTLTITSLDYQTYVSDPIEVSRDECHVITETIEILLQSN
ncbi:hypothetical protein L3X39_03490 [Sabulilitoribacter multivorans]|uniref:Carboxypeptidase regulatory-like domain-containing protein n=1 Tax=Flaviramulus multivorans TaxID=1304750 RepID=A0ABS9IH32_9FLAO|nr:hypothetical protein [Flaviramulus multivorans]MCF7559688.1 hypothetical protein [Flaviramulus multivorans]